MTDRDGCIALNLVSGIGFSRFQMLSEWFGAPGQVFNHAQEEYEKLKVRMQLRTFDPYKDDSLKQGPLQITTQNK